MRTGLDKAAEPSYNEHNCSICSYERLIAVWEQAVYNGKAMKGTSREMICSAQKAAGG